MAGAYVPGFSHRSIFLRLGNQVLLDNQIKGVYPEDIIAAVYRPVVSQEVLSFASVIRILQWRYLIMPPEYLPRRSLEERLGRHRVYSPDPLARRLVRIPEPPRRRERRVKDRPIDPRRIKVPVFVECLSRLDMTEKILLDRMEKWLRLRKGKKDKVYQPLGEEPLIARIRAS